ncbi:LysR family transcriptional regulator [Bordetella sp. BOR01]|uniref:LysR family transcriptional regulator n=1 Tax=Bordetella sp. BOR01 TaxID=2854779 RepID=UPI001C4745E5|nr:LysR family transcriptional regulator [Bordetella sp. BOR01]MBV7484953.1 LysR family transcriptional regulator [Bordetella sp. BOR01]
MRNLDLDALQIFKAVAERGGVARAAAHLNRVQSNVSTRLRQLEAGLGTTLFQRQNRRLVLSAQGRLLLDYAERLLRLSDEAQAALRDGTPRGLLRVGTMESTAAARLPPILAAYHGAWPQVRIELVSGTSGGLVNKVHSGEIEAAFVAQPYAEDGLDGVPAFTEDLVLISPLAGAPVTRAQDLRDTTLIAFSTGCSYRRILEAWLAQESVAAGRIMEFASYHAIVACVAAGAGVAVVPRSVLGVLQAGATLRVCALPLPLARARTMLVWRRGHQSPALDALRAELPDRVAG